MSSVFFSRTKQSWEFTPSSTGLPLETGRDKVLLKVVRTFKMTET